MSTAVIALRSASFDVIIDGRIVCRAHLVDIPTTLTPSSFNDLKATSSNPPTQPRGLPEPKNKGAKVPQAKDLKEIHERYGVLVKEALQAARDAGVKEWCNPRVITTEQNDDNDIRQWHEMFSIMQSFRGGEDKTEIQLSGSGKNEFRIEDIHGEIISNPNDSIARLTILLTPPQTFYIPARSSLIIDSFPSASSALTSYTLNSSRFDIIILDPPWYNNSVSRLKTKKNLSYQTMDNLLVQLPPVGNWLASGGIVGVWCTNNLRKINTVKTTIFKRWGVELVAEWIWLKVTTHGEPVVNLSSSFRKPYEILLIGRKTSKEHRIDIPERKVIIGVPAYHSQKPCLKEIFDELVPDGYRGCELYARNLVEGWMSVGDECLKFMRHDCWTTIPGETE